MCRKWVYLVLLACVLGSSAAQAANVDWIRAAYWDSHCTTGWADEAVSAAIRDGLEKAGYQILNADQLKAWMNARIADMEKAATLTKDKEVIKNIKAEFGHYETGFNKVYGMINAGKLKTPQEANAAISEYKNETHLMENISKELADETNQRMDSKEKVMGDLARHVSLLVMISIGVGLLICLLTSILITRSITAPLGNAVGIARRLAEGDLTATAENVSRDEVGQLLSAMNTMVESLHAMIGKIKDTSSQVASAADQIA